MKPHTKMVLKQNNIQMKQRLLLALITLILLDFQVAKSQTPWDVPPEKTTKIASFKFTDEVRKDGEAIYKKNCVSCHGGIGLANFQPLVPSPGDPATEKFSKQTDGDLFYKITTGRMLMPTFKDILTEEERWKVIAYVRSFHKDYVQPDPAKAVADTTGGAKGTKVKLSINFNSERKTVEVIATSEDKGVKTMAAGVDIVLFVKRHFGKLKIDETKTTNASGVAVFPFPTDLPGDKDGNVELIAKIDNDKFGEVITEAKMPIATPTQVTSLLEQRAMWGVRSKAPIWLILSYLGAVGIVWLVIFIIVGKLKKLHELGSKKTTQESDTSIPTNHH